ncbi:uncharacterized protein LOC128205972 isoform X2 [Mya arenaria]|uniref:uncharacterized protein LOC128205972 isoform X2 n=1 Tax=Mya arenaria TaxID=6604 RepID=UPI0022E97BCA|nr:uncharacterized protein LOC128205972 isoform X2 [Mya arenaria]
MANLQTEIDTPSYDVSSTRYDEDSRSRYDDVDVESILARCERRRPPLFSRKRCIYQAPEFIQRLPATETVDEGSTVTFGCKVVGFPDPTITWYKDDDVIGRESRAMLDSGDNGIHSIKLSDISKCDAGAYKLCASNREAKSKLRNKKRNKKGRSVASAPLFPAIIEYEADEVREARATDLQPESPLTPIYCTISRKSPIMWPEFLGNWAYNCDEDVKRGEIESLEMGNEDVFYVEGEIVPPPIFVSSAFAMLNSHVQFHPGSKNEHLHHTDAVDELPDMTTSSHEQKRTTNYSPDGRVRTRSFYKGDKEKFDREVHCMQPNKQTPGATHNGIGTNSRCEVINNNSPNTSKGKPKDTKYSVNAVVIDHTSEDGKTIHSNVTNNNSIYDNNPENVSEIAVNRSYARGNSTFSVAKRSPSPFSTRRKGPVVLKPAGAGLKESLDPNSPALQNKNNEIILNKLNKQNSWPKKTWDCVVKHGKITEVDDLLLDMMLLVCATTAGALLLDISPSSHVANVMFVMLAKLAFVHILRDI